MNNRNIRTMLRLFTCHVRGSRLLIAVFLLLGVASSAVSLITPLLSKSFVDAVSQNHDYGKLPRLVAALLALALADIVLGTTNRMIHTRLSTRVLTGMRERLFAQCLRAPLGHLERYRHGDLMNRFAADLPKVQVLLIDGVIGLIQNTLFLLVAAAVLLNLSASLALLSFAGLVVALVITASFRKPVETGTRIIREAMVEISHFLSERLSFLRAIRLHAAQAEDRALFSRLNARFSQKLLRFQMVDSAASGLPGLALSLNLAGVYLLGGRLLESGEITLGTFVAFMLYQARLTGPALGLLGLVRSVQESRISLERVSEVLADEDGLPAEMSEVRGAEAVIFNKVTFSYPGRDPVIRNLSLKIAQGERVALFGVSGAGKSTLVQLLFGLRKPKQGDISLMRKTSQFTTEYGVDYVRRLGYAGAEPFLIHGTVLENVFYGNPPASFEDVVEAAKAAEAHDFVMSLVDGYETVIGGRGSALSDGQRQRIGLTRLFLQRARFMVLDEAFSGLDPETEGRIRRNMYERFPNSTILLISHRLHALTEFNRLLLLEKAEICQVSEQDLVEHMTGNSRQPREFTALQAV